MESWGIWPDLVVFRWRWTVSGEAQECVVGSGVVLPWPQGSSVPYLGCGGLSISIARSEDQSMLCCCLDPSGYLRPRLTGLTALHNLAGQVHSLDTRICLVSF